LQAFNLDGREFIRKSFADLARVDTEAGRTFRPFEHVAMNLPATAIEFVGRINRWTKTKKNDLIQ
jgi:hypothetical protein